MEAFLFLPHFLNSCKEQRKVKNYATVMIMEDKRLPVQLRNQVKELKRVMDVYEGHNVKNSNRKNRGKAQKRDALAHQNSNNETEAKQRINKSKRSGIDK